MIDLVTIAPARCTLGISNEGSWYVRRGEDVAWAVEPERLMPFVACLEVAKADLTSLLRTALKRRQLDPLLESTFPYSEIAAAGLRMRSTKWITLATEWLDNVHLSDRLAAALRDALARKDGTQKERQRMKRRLAAQ